MGKRLQLDYIHIKEVKFAEKSEIVKGILYVNNSNFPHQKWDSHIEKSIL